MTKGESMQGQVFNLLKSLGSSGAILTVPKLFIECFGSIDAALFTSQLLYWSDKGARKDDFFYKTDKEWMDETHLSRNAIRKTRKQLEDLGILETKVHRANGFPTVHYKINPEALVNYVNEHHKIPNGTNDCPKQDERSSQTGQTLTYTTTYTTTDKDNQDKVSPFTPTLGKETVPPIHGRGTLHKMTAFPDTPAALFLFEKMAVEAAAKGYNPPKRFPTVTHKQEFEEAEQRVGSDRMKELVLAAIKTTHAGPMKSIVSYAVKAAKNGAPQNVNGDLYNTIVDALRLNPSASPAHATRAATFAETCEREGYTAHHIRKAGLLWWSAWPGNKGQGPSDSQFVQTMETVKKERL